MNEPIIFTIPLRPITKKNHSRIITRGGKKILVPSEACNQYVDDCGWHISYKWAKIAGPINVKCLFYMPTLGIVDLVGLLQSIDDILVHYGVITDDNSCVIAAHDGSRVLYDKENPRTVVIIEPIKIEEEDENLLCYAKAKKNQQADKARKEKI